MPCAFKSDQVAPEVPKTTPKGRVGGWDTIGRNIKVLGENGKGQNEANLVVILIHKWLTNVAKKTAQTKDEIHYQFKHEASKLLSCFLEGLKKRNYFPPYKHGSFPIF